MKFKLALYLKREGITTGPLAKNTSHSGLLDLRRALLGIKKPEIKPEQFVFGSALHEQQLEKKKEIKVDKKSQGLINAMMKALDKTPLVRKLMASSVKEEKLFTTIKGILIAYILDINCKAEKIGADLKTTSCTTLEKFIEKAIEYGYFNQAVTYIIAEKLKLFFFIGVTKEKNPKVFIISVTDPQFKQEMTYAREELEFLLYFYSLYGKIIE